MKKPFLVAAFVALAAFGAVSATHAATVFRMGDGRYYDPATGRTALTAEELQPNAATSTVSFPLKDAILRGRERLAQEIQRDATSTPKIVKSDDIWISVTLAVWDRATDHIRLIPIQKKGQQVRQAAVSDTNVDVTVSNGLNSTFRLDDPNAAVVAIRYPILKDVSTKKKKQFQVEEVVYTPYSSALNTPEMVQWGKQLLNGFVAEVYAAFENQLIPSKAFPEQPLTKVIDRDTTKAVAMIEHVDGTSLERDAKQTIERFFVTLAANGKDSYAYSRSKAGALGLVQFMPASYEKFIKHRPELGLISAFETAMRNPQNALKAELAYLDYQLAALTAKDRQAIADQEEKRQEFAVAAYNGGPSRVSKAIPSWDQMFGGADALAALHASGVKLTADVARMRKLILAEEDEKIWKPMQIKLNQARNVLAQVQEKETQMKRSRLRAETIEYVQKYRKVMDWLKADGISFS